MKNETILQCFEWYLPDDATFFSKVKALAPSFFNMGITACWLPPAYKGAAGIHDVGYGVYDMYDLGEFDQKGTIPTKYGTRRQYLAAVSALHKNKVDVIADIVFNHRMGGDSIENVTAEEDDADNREKEISGDHPIACYTKFTFPGRNGKYSKFVWDHTCFDGTDWDAGSSRSAVYKFAHKSWDDNVDSENGNYDYLMGCDLDMSNPAVIEELTNWGKWYMDTVQLEGVRLDAVKHIEFCFFEKWLADMNAHIGRNLFAVGEYWSTDINHLLHYLDVNNNCLSLFDVPLHQTFYQISYADGNMDMGAVFSHTLVQERPGNCVTFVDNHDTQPGQALSSFVNGWFKPLAYALILLTDKGIPCVFYGDLYGIPHDGIPPVENLETLIRIRQKYAYGLEHDYFDDQDIVGFTREGTEEMPGSGIAVLMSDRNEGTKSMYISERFAGREFIDVLGNSKDTVTVDASGNGVFMTSPGSVSVWMQKEEAEKKD